MPGKAGAMRFYRAIFPTGMGQSANNLLQVIYFTLLKRSGYLFFTDYYRKVRVVN
jgi:hypothetical protein